MALAVNADKALDIKFTGGLRVEKQNFCLNPFSFWELSIFQIFRLATKS